MNVDFLLGGGEMGERMRQMDWTQTSLGLPEKWQQSLKTAVRIILTSRQPMFVWWGEDLINLYNDAYKAIVGGKHPEVLGQPASVVWREIWDQVGPRAESVIFKNEGTYDEALLLIMERNGYPEETYYTFSYSPIPDDHGGIGGIICANTDDTQRIIGERQLALLRDLAAQTADARTFDEACRLSINCLKTNLYDLPFAMIYLVEPDQRQVFLAGTSGIDRHHPAVLETVDLDSKAIWSFAEVIRKQKPIISDLESLFPDLPTGAWNRPPHQAVAVPIAASGQTGKSGILLAGLNPFRLFDDNYQGFMDLVAAQISASIANAQAYEEERKRAETLAELDRAKTIFFSNVSHEFRTPLTLMLGPLEDLLTHPSKPLPTEDREQLETVHRNSLRLLKLVNTLLDFSRIEAGRIQAVYELTDLSAFTAELASVFRSAIERAGMTLNVDCPPLPEQVYVDREMWEKVVLNLLSNAFKFTFAGAITVGLQWLKDRVELIVQDTGTGIPEEELPHLFERFHRVPGAKGRTYEGSGIGLSLVQELVKLHGGTIEVESVVDQGTCFTVTIPTGSAHLPTERISAARTLGSTALGATPYLEEALRWLPNEESSFPIATEEILATAAPMSVPSARILLADDNADMRDYVKRLLSQQYEVEAVADGLAALTVARQQLPDLVLTDVMMPGLDGFGLLQALRSDPQTRKVPIILLSARAGEEARVEGLEAGADDYLIKPFSARELLARVEAALKMARLRQEAMQREQALRIEAEVAKAHLETVLAGIQDQFFVLDRQWCYTFANDQVAEVVGVPKEELVGQNIWQLFPDLIGSDFYHQLHQALQSQTVARFEYFYLPWRCWFENRIYPFDEGVTIFVTDINDRKQAEEALREAHVQLESALIAGAIYTWRWNILENQVTAGKSFAELFAVDPDEAAKGLPIEHFVSAIHPEDRSRVVAAIQQAIETHEEYVTEYRVFTATGEERWLSARGRVEYDAAGEPIAFPGALADITERKRAEAEREQLLAREQIAREQAETANRIKDEFLAVLSHELRSPLNPILGWARLLQTRSFDAAKTAQALATIERNAKLQSELIEDLLDVSRILQGKLSLNVSSVDLASTVQAAMETVRLAAEAKAIQIQTYLEPNLEPVSGDASRLQQIVWNLLSNAIKFTPAGGRVEIRLHRVDRQAEIKVSDTGRGISPQFLPYVFDYFRQADATTTRKFGGLGLGLAIVRHLVELHGGTIQADSLGEDQGATFTVRLPLLTHSKPNQEQPTLEEAPTLDGVKVLVVDDDIDALEFATFLLEQYGAEVTAATSALTALAAIQQSKPDVLLSDIGMPEIDGYTLMRQVRTLPPEQGGEIPAIALTAYAGEIDHQRAISAGFQKHLPKPIEPADLIAAIAAISFDQTQNF
ncbi:MAG TPA: ATP-binding protein [Trichocoleus sp.]